jgi:hypothetical protein
MLAAQRSEVVLRPSGAALASVSSAAAREAASAAAKLPGMGETTSLIAQKLVQHAAPLVQHDPTLQRNVGRAIGEAVGPHVAGPAWVGAGALAVGAAALAWMAWR